MCKEKIIIIKTMKKHYKMVQTTTSTRHNNEQGELYCSC